MSKTAGIASLAILLTVAASLINWWPRSIPAEATKPLELTAELLQPPLTDEGLVMSEPGEPVEFVYRLQNHSDAPLQNLKAKLFCQCALTREFPTTIAPNETVEFSFRFNAPRAGMRRERVVVDSGENTLLILEPTIRAQLEAPQILSIPKEVTARCVKGEELTKEILIHTIEKRDSTPLIRDLLSPPEDELTFKLLNLRERADHDPELVRRDYRFHLIISGDSPSERRLEGVVVLDVDKETLKDPPKITYQIAYLDPIAFVPDSVAFQLPGNSATAAKRISIINRSSIGSRVELHRFDRSVLDVQLLKDMDEVGNTLVIKPVPFSQAEPMSVSKTSVVLLVNGDQEIEFPVHFLREKP